MRGGLCDTQFTNNLGPSLGQYEGSDKVRFAVVAAAAMLRATQFVFCKCAATMDVPSKGVSFSTLPSVGNSVVFLAENDLKLTFRP